MDLSSDCVSLSHQRLLQQKKWHDSKHLPFRRSKLTYLLKDLEYEVLQGDPENVRISQLVYDSRKVTRGCLFVCIPGSNVDGHDFALQAAKDGAAALVVSRPVEGLEETGATVILVENSRYALAFLSAAWFGHPAEKLKVIGITGTKGKTTSTYLVKSILENAGYHVGLVGTIEVIIGETHIHAENTTPESYLLQDYFVHDK